MNRISKFENGVVTVLCAAVMWSTMFIGAFELCYESLDMSYEPALYMAIVYGIITGYWIIRKAVFRIISIVKR